MRITPDVSDVVASAMDSIMKSAEHKSLFSHYKTASKKCPKCDKEECMCDSAMAKDHKESEKTTKDHDSSSASDFAVDVAAADDNDAKKKAKEKEEKSSTSDSSSADDLEVAAGYDVAIDSLLTASAALDTVGLGNGSALALKIASFVVSAKKKEKAKKDSKKSSGKSSKDSMSAKDKKVSKDSKKPVSKDSKKSDSKKSSK